MTFHSGEIAVQTQAGVREEAQRLCRVISSVIKPAAQEFLCTQQLGITSTVDTKGRVWASLLAGQPGFVQVLDQETLQMHGFFQSCDRLHQNLSDNAQMGLLVIDLATRKRLRLNGQAKIQPGGQINISVQQAFFNCPQYIQVRHLETGVTQLLGKPEIFTREAMNEADKNWITQADTFFIASSHPEIGADASHRGGYPGFVQVLQSNKLEFPDYAGNNMFQTFGNLAVNPSAGLLFINFEEGHTLQLVGKAEVIWDIQRLNDFAGAKRLVEFEIKQIVETQNATPLHWRFGEYSPANPHF